MCGAGEGEEDLPAGGEQPAPDQDCLPGHGGQATQGHCPQTGKTGKLATNVNSCRFAEKRQDIY